MRFFVMESIPPPGEWPFPQRFYTMLPEGDTRDLTLMSDGRIGYKIVAEVKSDYEAQVILFGKDFADQEQAKRAAEGR